MGKKKVGNQLRLPPQARTEKGTLTRMQEGSRGKACGQQSWYCLLNQTAKLIISPVSTVTEIREAISQLSEQDRYLLMAQLFATVPEPDENDPALLAALDEAIADDDADRVHSIEEVRAMIPQWISKLPSQQAP
jgi:hypothetical protein